MVPRFLPLGVLTLVLAGCAVGADTNSDTFGSRRALTAALGTWTFSFTRDGVADARTVVIERVRGVDWNIYDAEATWRRTDAAPVSLRVEHRWTDAARPYRISRPGFEAAPNNPGFGVIAFALDGGNDATGCFYAANPVHDACVPLTGTRTFGP